MIIKKIKYYLFLFLSLPCVTHAQVLDTNAVFEKLVGDLKRSKNLSYEYTMDAVFPNGNKDHLAGTTYFNSDDKVCYTECAAFTMIYAPDWFYKADHIKKIVYVIDLRKEKDKKMNNQRQKAIFKFGALDNFLDLVLLKQATIKAFKPEGNGYQLSIGFRDNPDAKSFDIVYDTLNYLPVSTSTIVLKPWQKTAKGIQSAKISTRFYNYKTVKDKSIYSNEAFFSYKKHKIELKKYENYKLSTKL